jgi:SAM-dependent methyltransferase
MAALIDSRNVWDVFEGKSSAWSSKGAWVEVQGNDSPLDDAASRLVHSGISYVDFGCGDGRAAAKVAAVLPVGQLTLIDLSRAMARAAATRLAPYSELNVAVVVADATRTPLPDAHADLVVARQLLQHVPEPSAVVREGARILRPGGTLLVQVPGPRYFATWQAFTGSYTTDPIGRFSPEELHDLLTAAGLVATITRHAFRFRFANTVAAFRFLLGIGLVDKCFDYDAAPGHALDDLLDDAFLTAPLRKDPIEVEAEYLLGVGGKP